MRNFTISKISFKKIPKKPLEHKKFHINSNSEAKIMKYMKID